MTELPPAAPPQDHNWSHACHFCGAGACFGFVTYRGEIWTCLEHRDEGHAHHVYPGGRPAELLVRA